MKVAGDNHRSLVLAGVSALASIALMSSQVTALPLIDGASRTVTIPPGVISVVPAGPPAQVLLQALAPDLLAGLVEPFKAEHAIYLAPRIAALPQIPMLSRTDAPGDVAAVAALKPGLSVDYGNVSARYVAATTKIEQELRIPAAIFDGDLSLTGSVVSGLGDALNLKQRGQDLSAAIDDVLARVKSLSDLPEAAKPGIYMARGADGLQAMRAGTSFDEPIRLAGGRNVVMGSGGPFKHMTVEDVIALKPDVVIFGEVGALSSPLRAALPKETKVVLDAGEPYNVLTGPPSVNRIVGLLALAAILHPDKMAADTDELRRLETKLFPIPPGLAEPAPLQVQK